MVDKAKLQKNLRSKLENRQTSESNKSAVTTPSKPTPVKKNKADEVKLADEKDFLAKPALNLHSKDAKKESSPLVSAIEAKVQRQKEDAQAVAAIAAQDNTLLRPEPIAPVKKGKVKTKPVKVKSQKKVKPLGERQPMSTYLPLICWYSLALLIVLFDQMTKVLASSELIDSAPVVLTSWLEFRLVHNPGAAFSLFAEAGGWQRPFLVFVSVAVSLILIVWLARISIHMKLLPAALALILGGAIGNLVDRAVSGYVVDFISLHYQALYFPSFNVADAAISCGAFLLFLDMFFGSGKKQKQPVTTATQTPVAPIEPTPTTMTVDQLLNQADAKKTNPTG